MNLFGQIIEATKQESAERKTKDSLKSLKKKVRDLPPTRGFARGISAQGFRLIAEIKLKSPSMDRMSVFAERTIATAHHVYSRHPVVCAISVLTQASHFGGNPNHLRKVHRETQKPILRKDFIFEEYEVYYSRAIGADAILLMANVVTDKTKFQDLHDLALELGLDVLCEVHAEEELAVLPPTMKICGVNSRKFKSNSRLLLSRLARYIGKDVSVDLDAFDLVRKLPGDCLKIAESGITAKNVNEVLKKFSFDAALVGTSLLKKGAEGLVVELDRFKAAIDQAGLPRPAGSDRLLSEDAVKDTSAAVRREGDALAHLGR